MVENKGFYLVTALGSADLVLELMDFFNGPQSLAYADSTRETRKVLQGKIISEIHLFCTKSKKIQRALTGLIEILALEYPAVKIIPVQLSTEDIATSDDDYKMQQEVEKHFSSLPGEHTIISSAGRKTLTQRITESAMKHGCLGYLAIIGPDNVQRHEHEKLTAIWSPSSQLLDDNWHRSKELNKGSIGSGFRCMSVLPLMVQQRLQSEKIGQTKGQKILDTDWLKELPKADLHCHLGGCQDEQLILKLASQLLIDLDVDQKKQMEIQYNFCQMLKIRDITKLEPSSLRGLTPGKDPIHCLQNLEILFADFPDKKHLLTAVLVSSLDIQQIRRLSRDGSFSDDGQVNWPARTENSLKWYMKCGDLGGSSLLQSENTLRMALYDLMQKSTAENIRYLEVRCSPGNYIQAGLLTLNQAMDCLLDEADKFTAIHPGFKINFIIMATRHKSRIDLAAHIAAAVLFSQRKQEGKSRVVGFDLAGQEEKYDPKLFQNDFMPLHRHFLNVTIHAGEMADEDKIWQAIYLLHAKRIGHGLKLVDNKKMMGFIRDNGLALEMCPSSNNQTNLFCTFPNYDSHDMYPLHEYLEYGIEVSINTDNRFISDTSLSKEYWQAAAMSPGGLSKWQTLKLLKSSFQAAFLPKDEKDELLKKVDDEIFSLLLADYFGENTYSSLSEQA